MANARKCDVCGKYYSLYDADRYLNKPNAISFLTKEGDGSTWNSNPLDLCPECLKSIQDHIRFLRTKEIIDEKPN